MKKGRAQCEILYNYYFNFKVNNVIHYEKVLKKEKKKSKNDLLMLNLL